MDTQTLTRLARVVASFRVGGAIPIHHGEEKVGDTIETVRASVVPRGQTVYNLVRRVDTIEGAGLRHGPLVPAGWTLDDLAKAVSALPDDYLEKLPSLDDRQDPAADLILSLAEGPVRIAGIDVHPDLALVHGDGVRVVGELVSMR